jgi:hypothetical protein
MVSSESDVVCREGSIAMVRNQPKGRKLRIKTLVVQDTGFCNRLVTCSSK